MPRSLDKPGPLTLETIRFGTKGKIASAAVFLEDS
jgi:hypothetical protein